MAKRRHERHGRLVHRGGGRARAAAPVGAALVALVAGTPPAGAVTLPAGFQQRTLASGLTDPTAVAWAPDGRIFIAEQSGRVLVVPANPTPDQIAAPTTLLDISNHVSDNDGRGLLGLAADSDFATNHRL